MRWLTLVVLPGLLVAACRFDTGGLQPPPGEGGPKDVAANLDRPRDLARDEPPSADAPRLDAPSDQRATDRAADAKKLDAKPDAKKDVPLQPDLRAPDLRKPDARPPDLRKPDLRPPDLRKPDVRPPDLRKPDLRPPDLRKPDSQKTCAQIYGAASNFQLCASTATECRFYTDVYPGSQTCQAVCAAHGGSCLDAKVPQGWQSSTERCSEVGDTSCTNSAYGHMCYCSH